MNQSITRRIALFGVALLFICSAVASGADDSPLKLKGTSVVAGDPFAKQGAPFTTEGTGTHLGDFTGEGQVFFKQRKDVVIGTGTQTFTAASGDQLFTEFAGELDATGHAIVEFVILGGTGRFEGATGTFTADVQTIAQEPPTFTFTAEGSISF